ncbi:MAG: hotdog fold thioesterase [Bacteroidetes bacterium]|nr:hotdog fold thioesterase [Bacteroidota bacterium]HET6243610.1 hotdog fold thioesterase [Bacteroidia bacterium]
MTKNKHQEKIVGNMYSGDLFSQWLGIEVLEVSEGYCKLKLKVRKEMLNGFSILHGGVTFSLADTALAFASNSRGKISVSTEASISFIDKVNENDFLTAVAQEASLSEKTGVYFITVSNQNNKKVALFKGTVHRTGKEWFSK